MTIELPALVFLKYSLDNVDQVYQIANYCNALKSQYNICVCLLQREENFCFPFIPIFDGRELHEFNGKIVSLDYKSLTYLARASSQQKFYMPLQSGVPQKTTHNYNDIVNINSIESLIGDSNE